MNDPHLIKPTTKLNHDQSVQIRLAYANAVAVGLTLAEIKSINTKLAADFGCSTNQIVAVQSQMKIRADRLLTQLGLKEVLSRDTLIAAYEDWMVGGEYSAEQALAAALTTINKRSSRELSPDEVSVLMKRYAALMAEDEISKIRDEPSADQGSTPTLSAASCRVSSHNAIGPEHTNYDFAAKRSWRLEIINSFDRVLSDAPSALRADMNVLFLPSVDRQNMEVQIKLLEGIGFKRNRMFGVEGTKDEDLQRQFLHNAHELGIVPVYGKLEKLLPKDPKKYGLVWLDFPGPINLTYLEIGKQLLLADVAAVSVNFMQGRESAQVQNSLDLSRVVNDLEGFEKLVRDQGRYYHTADPFHAVRQDIEPGGEVLSAAELREAKGEAEFFNVIGQKRKENLRNLGDTSGFFTVPSIGAQNVYIASRIFIRHLASFFAEIFGDLARARNAIQVGLDLSYQHQPALVSSNANALLSMLIDIVCSYCTYPPNFTLAERCSYQSEADGRKYFYSVTARADTPRSRYDELKRTGSALRDYMLFSTQRNNDVVRYKLPMHVTITDQYGRATRVSGGSLKGSDLIRVSFCEPNGDMSLVCTIRYSHLKTDLERILNIRKSYPDGLLRGLNSLPQKIIEA